jgi:uncharacterized membrane protein
MEGENSELPSHIEGTVQAIAQLQNEHHQEATTLDHAIDQATGVLGRPAFLVFVTLIICLWAGLNLMLPLIGEVPLDPAPFPWLISGVSLMSLYMATLILTTQRRADKLARRREQMTLELAFLGEHKNAKIIALLEELRRDSPNVKNRVDQEADAMATPVDAHAMLNAIEGTHEEMIAADAAENGRDTPAG